MNIYVDDMGWGEVVGYEDYSGVGDCVEVTDKPEHDEWRYITYFENRGINLYIFQSQVKEILS